MLIRVSARVAYIPKNIVRLELIASCDFSNTSSTERTFSVDKNDFTSSLVVDLGGDAQVVADLSFTTAVFSINLGECFGFYTATEKAVESSRSSRDAHCKEKGRKKKGEIAVRMKKMGWLLPKRKDKGKLSRTRLSRVCRLRQAPRQSETCHGCRFS
jgi:hypothetical protein